MVTLAEPVIQQNSKNIALEALVVVTRELQAPALAEIAHYPGGLCRIGESSPAADVARQLTHVPFSQDSARNCDHRH